MICIPPPPTPTTFVAGAPSKRSGKTFRKIANLVGLLVGVRDGELKNWGKKGRKEGRKGDGGRGWEEKGGQALDI